MDEPSGTQPKRKIFYLDTCVLLHNPHALIGGDFKDNIIDIPMAVVEEIDELKVKNDPAAAFSAREACRIIDQLTLQEEKNGRYTLPGGGELQFSPRLPAGEFEGMKATIDNEIIIIALRQQRKKEDHPVLVISDDAGVLIKARILGLDAGRYSPDYVKSSGVLQDTDSINLSPVECQDWFERKKCVLQENRYPNRVYSLLCDGNARSDRKHASSDECFVGRDGKTLEALELINCPVAGSLKIGDKRQAAAWKVLNDKKIELVVLFGSAGTGKTLLSLAAGIEQVLERNYEQLIVTRPVVPVGDRDKLGFLPGTLEEKMDPWLEPIWDNLFFILQASLPQANKRNASELAKLFSAEKHDGSRQSLLDIFRKKFPIEVVSIGHLRGRTLRNAYVVIDESQNTDKLEIQTIIRRAGEGTKMVLAGDVTQVDIHPYGGKIANGLSLTAAAFATEPSASIIHLHKVYRSRLAELAAKLL